MIRKLQENDIDAIMKIWLETSIEAHDFINKQYWIDNYEIVKNKYIPVSDTFVYEKDNDVCGFISIINNNFIGALFVKVNCQRQGIGSCLINYVQNIYSKLLLNVYVDNSNAVEFYKKHKFEIIDEQLDESTNRTEFTMKYEI